MAGKAAVQDSTTITFVDFEPSVALEVAVPESFYSLKINSNDLLFFKVGTADRADEYEDTVVNVAVFDRERQEENQLSIQQQLI